DYLRLKKNRIVTLREIETAAKRWAHHQSQHPRVKCFAVRHVSKNRFIWSAINWLRFLGCLKIPASPPLSSQVIAFAKYMRQEKGLSEKTIQRRCHDIQIFFNRISTLGYSLARITIFQIESILVQKLKQKKYALRTIQTFASALRSFFRYAENCGWCRPSIAEAIKTPRIYKHASLPSSPTWEEVKRLLKTTQSNRPIDIRDRAILLLFAVYGLRAGEVSRLRLEDFNWEQETLHIIRSKGGQPQQFPINQMVGQSIIRYLKKVRPHSSYREVFLTVRFPICPLSTGALTQLVSRRWKPLNVPILHHGPHSLRHACATRLINQGASLKTIADQLGHRDLETTRIYAKVDLSHLREVANFNLGGLL
ncbi:site-specific integrase, partial [Candidatus Dependentiae bacterium]|nr:site-specific integrase [Candidatus Dependentiae bacterium]